MHISDFHFLNEKPCHYPAIENINAQAFGPGRHTLAAARIREKGPHQLDRSFVCLLGDDVVGSVRMTPVWIGQSPCFMLGPLAVSPDYKKQGIGRKLVELAVNSVAELAIDAVLLVGDEPYYAPMGFGKTNADLIFPGPVDPKRILINSLGGAGSSPSGNISFRPL